MKTPLLLWLPSLMFLVGFGLGYLFGYKHMVPWVVLGGFVVGWVFVLVLG